MVRPGYKSYLPILVIGVANYFGKLLYEPRETVDIWFHSFIFIALAIVAYFLTQFFASRK
jgi:hypothetical protein